MTAPENNNSYVAGRFVAANYGRWSQLPLWVPLNVTGSRSFVVLNPQVNLPDGRSFLPYAINAPIVFGAEIITPSAVAYNSDNTRCTITADFTIEHSLNDPISSATIGLQEALNDAAGFGGCVTVDGQWTNLGGTDLMISDADTPSGTGIEDVRTGPAGGGGGGNLSGTLTSGFMPVAVAANTLADGLIDQGVTDAGMIAVNGSGNTSAISGILLIGGAQGVIIDTLADDILPSDDGQITLSAGTGVGITAQAGIQIQDNSTTGIQITSVGSGDVTVTANSKIAISAPNVTIGPLVSPSQLYSAAGTPLPDPTTVAPGTEATVSDATLPTYMGAYVSGGAVVCRVISDGATNWFTH